MRCRSMLLITALIMSLAARSLVAQAPEEKGGVPAPNDERKAGQNATHQELIAMREAIIKDVNSKDVDGLLSHLHPNVVVVWQNAVISRGHDGVRKYYAETLGGPNAVLDSYTVEPTVQELTILHGDNTGIAYGTVLCHFKFKGGRQFDLDGPWSATMVRIDGSWTIASFHASAGLFDNPLLLIAQTWLVRGCVLSAVGGLLIGAAVMAFVRKRKPA